MKRVKKLYNKINDIDIIMDMYDRVISKNTKNKNRLCNFDDYYSCNIESIRKIINSNNYIPNRYNIFLIREPKLRIIMSQSIKDKIINHLVAEYVLVKVFESKHTDSMCATRLGKGTIYGVKLLKKYLNKMKRDHNNFYYGKHQFSI